MLPLLYWICIASIWAVYRLFFHFPETVDELLAKPLLWLVPLLPFWHQSAPITRRMVRQSLTRIKPPLFTLVLPVVGTAFYALLIHLSSLHWPQISFSSLLMIICTNTATAVTEEIVFRAVLFSWFSKLATPFRAFWIVQILFLLMHIPLLFSGTLDPVAILRHILFILLMGAAYTLIYWKTKSLPAAILSHATWNTLAVLLTLP